MRTFTTTAALLSPTWGASNRRWPPTIRRSRAGPDLASAYNNRGCVLMFMERFDDALVAYGRALMMLAPDEPSS